MHSSSCIEDRNVFALKSSNRCSREYEVGMNGSPDRAIAHLVCKERSLDYWMKKSRITVGRSSSKRSSADVNMGESNFISRSHLEIYTTDARFYALVTGKNGVFVDDIFHRKGGPAFELPNSCLIRFPSTEIKIQFSAVQLSQQNIDIKAYPSQDLQLIQTSVAFKSNSYGELFPPTISNFSIVQDPAALIPIKEEIVDHVAADHGDSKRFEHPSGYSAPHVVRNSPHNREEKDIHTAKSNPQTIGLPSNEYTKPPFSYAQLIIQAITSQVDRQLTLSGIYNYITKQYPYYRHGDKGWQNSIRHNLSLNRYFVKVPRAQEEAGKGCFWRIDPNQEAVVLSQAFKKRRQRQTPYGKNGSFETLQSPGLNASESNTVVGTPDDSCASWEGPHANGDEVETSTSSEHITPTSEQALRCLSSVSKSPYNTVPYAAVNLLAPLPPSMNKPHFIFTKPLPVSSNADHVVSTQAPVILSSQSNGSLSAQEVYTNTGESVKVINESIQGQDMKSKLNPFQIMSQPKTIILRPTPNNSLNFNMPVGSQLIKLSYAPQTAMSNKIVCESRTLEHNGESEAGTLNSSEGTIQDGIAPNKTPTVNMDISLAQKM